MSHVAVEGGLQISQDDLNPSHREQIGGETSTKQYNYTLIFMGIVG